ncbi:MAG TPA: sulfite exporter TauE/SafE family protein [Firmicutes bacterium]|nr:sulfite exporter TauE/SafE family protein [Bacillota bacterium]
MFILYLIIGFSVGVLGGFFGVGGAFVLTPLLNTLGNPMINAVGTGLAFTVAVSIFGSIKHFQAGNVSYRIVPYIGGLSLLGVSLAQPVLSYLDRQNMADSYLRLAFIALLFLFSVLTLKKDKETEGEPQGILIKIKKIPPLIKLKEDEKISLWVILVMGLCVGFLSGLLGVGGGFILVPLFILVLGLDTGKAAGTSLAVLIITSSYGATLNFIEGRVLFDILIFMVVGSLLGTSIGVRATKNVREAIHKRSYGLFLMLMMAGIIITHCGHRNISTYFTIGVMLIFIITIISTEFKHYLFPGSKSR